MIPRATAHFTVLGVPVSVIQIPQVIAQMEKWIERRHQTKFIAVTGMHGVIEAQHDANFKRILNLADLVVPDGMPLVYLGRWQGHALQHRVCGPDLMNAFFASTGSRYRHFFYGGMPGVPEYAAEILQRRYGLNISGVYSPPFRVLSDSEEQTFVSQLRNSGTDVLWVALGTPKQERWMYEHRNSAEVPLIVGVGAAIDFASGRLKRAPPWMRDHGFEWLFRLQQEPRRLWKRYLIYGLEFGWDLLLERLRLRDFNLKGVDAQV